MQCICWFYLQGRIIPFDVVGGCTGSPPYTPILCEAFFFLFKNFSAKYFTPNLETVKFFKSFSSMTALSTKTPQNGGAPKQLRLIPVVLSQFRRLYYVRRILIGQHS